MEQESDSVKEQNVTRGLQLSSATQTFCLIPMFILIVSSVFALGPLKEAQKQQNPLLAAMIIIAIILLVTVAALPAIFTGRALMLFKKENKQAYQEGEQWLGKQSRSDMLIFNKNSTVNKRLYSKSD